jgi:bifunctional non-homologous end joining protein LigD
MTTVTIGRRTIELSNKDKVLFPHDGITKGALIAYYQAIAPAMLPHMKDRPVTMHRFPNGIADEGFYQKDIGEYFPNWIKRIEVPKEGGHNTYVICNDTATLVYLANQACITPHIWPSRTPKLDYPDKMIFDLDPGANDFGLVQQTALALRELLDVFGLIAYAMVTGSRGMHVIVPLDRRHSFDDVRACARAIANHLVDLEGGKQLTTEVRLEKRKKRMFIDATRNAWAQTTVAPYAIRALAGAPVATPVTWDEVSSASLSAQKFTIKNIEKRLDNVGDPLADFGKAACGLTTVLKGLVS